MTDRLRPRQLVVVTGTGTECGKTWVASALIGQLRRKGLRVAARKPVQSFEPGEVTDAEVLGQASGEAPGEVCPGHRWYPRPLAPPMAAEALGRPPFTIADLVAELVWPGAPGVVDVGVVEGAGGVRSPLAGDGDIVDLAAAIEPDLVVLVAGPALGTLNLVRLSADALWPWSMVVYLNRFDGGDELHRRNREWIEGRMDLAVDSTIDELGRRLEGRHEGLPRLPLGGRLHQSADPATAFFQGDVEGW